MGAKDQPHEKHAAPSTESHLLSLRVHVRALMHARAHMCRLYVCAYMCVLVCVLMCSHAHVCLHIVPCLCSHVYVPAHV